MATRPAAALLLLLPLLLAGCAEVWKRPGSTEAEADAALATCTQDARFAVPANMVRRVKTPARTVSEQECRTENNRRVCTTTTRHEPETYETIDLNAGERGAWRNQCMARQGFTYEGMRPLRLE